MGMLRQIGGLIIALFVFAAVITALSRLLSMRDLPNYIDTGTDALSNLFAGAFGATPKQRTVRRIPAQ